MHGALTLLIVDTGATEHVLTKAFSERAGLTLAPSRPGHDVTGASVESNVIERCQLELGELRLTFDNVPAIDGPSFFSDANIGGLLSPQRLSPDETVVVDLRAKRLVVRASAIETAGLRPVACVRHTTGTLGTRVSFAGGSPVTAILDTGAESTDAESSLVKGPAGIAVVAGYGVGGKPVMVTEARDVEVGLDGATFTLETMWLRDEISSPEDAEGDEVPRAVLGMDVRLDPCHRSATNRLGRALR